MKITSFTTIISLKKDLNEAIEKNHFNLQAPEVLSLSQQLDHLMTPLFKCQLNKNSLDQ